MLRTASWRVICLAVLYLCCSCTVTECVDLQSDATCSTQKTRCLTDAINCLTADEDGDKDLGTISLKLTQLEQEVAALKSTLSKAGQPSSFALLDQNGRLAQSLLPSGYDQYSAYDLAWQALHMAAAAACRGSTESGGSGCCDNKVLVRNTANHRTCAQICASSIYTTCDGEVSLDGEKGKATQDGQIIGAFYNYGCNHAPNGGSEASQPDNDIMRSTGYPYYSFCCCRKSTK